MQNKFYTPNFIFNPILGADGYKYKHHEQYPKGTKFVQDNLTARSDSYSISRDRDYFVVSGLQMAILMMQQRFQEGFFDIQEDKAMDAISKVLNPYFNENYNLEHFRALHQLGYLPVEIRAMKEGSVVPIGTPVLTIINTDERFFWLPNFLETILSYSIWKSPSWATTAATLKARLKRYVMEYTDLYDTPFDPHIWNLHDFSSRGLDGVDSVLGGVNHLTVGLKGTENVAALQAVEAFYPGSSSEEIIAGTIPATEHSVMCAGGKESELETFRRLLETYPSGPLGIVSDTWNLWRVGTEYAVTLKPEIMSREGKIVFRPDSGDPYRILCGYPYITLDESESEHDHMEYHITEKLKDINTWRSKMAYGGKSEVHLTENDWGTFYVVDFQGNVSEIEVSIILNDYGNIDYDDIDIEVGTFCDSEMELPELKGFVEVLYENYPGPLNSKGLKTLDSHVGVIYGDSMNLDRITNICEGLIAKGFDPTIPVFGIGSYTYQYMTRDTYGQAFKATGLVNAEGEEVALQKDPITGSGKKSAYGFVRVVRETDLGNAHKYKLEDSCTLAQVNSEENELKVVYLNGGYLQSAMMSLEEVRKNYSEHEYIIDSWENVRTLEIPGDF